MRIKVTITEQPDSGYSIPAWIIKVEEDDQKIDEAVKFSEVEANVMAERFEKMYNIR
jgi:hypothetical protein